MLIPITLVKLGASKWSITRKTAPTNKELIYRNNEYAVLFYKFRQGDIEVFVCY
jgi:hypothetical protein